MIRIAPSVSPDTAFFWEGAAAGRLLIQRCVECERLRHPPRPMCPHCQSLRWDTVEMSGRGEVFSFVLPRNAQDLGFDDPHIVVLVDLEEGVRLVSNLRDVEPDDAHIGMLVEVFYETSDNDVVLPQFRPRAGQT